MAVPVQSRMRQEFCWRMNQPVILVWRQRRILSFVSHYSGNGTAALVVTHNQQLALNMDSILTIEDWKSYLHWLNLNHLFVNVFVNFSYRVSNLCMLILSIFVCIALLFGESTLQIKDLSALIADDKQPAAAITVSNNMLLSLPKHSLRIIQPIMGAQIGLQDTQDVAKLYCWLKMKLAMSIYQDFSLKPCLRLKHDPACLIDDLTALGWVVTLDWRRYCWICWSCW